MLYIHVKKLYSTCTKVKRRLARIEPPMVIVDGSVVTAAASARPICSMAITQMIEPGLREKYSKLCLSSNELRYTPGLEADTRLCD